LPYKWLVVGDRKMIMKWPGKKQSLVNEGTDQYGRSSLWYHAAAGNVEAVQRDLKAGLSATASDKKGYGALHVAAQNGHSQIVKLLLAAGADPNAVDSDGNGPLWVSCYEGTKAISTDANLEIIAALLRSGANPHFLNKAGVPPTIWRARSPQVDAIFAAAGIVSSSTD
jgi:ankyrin repeat protein